MPTDSLAFPYENVETIDKMQRQVLDCVESISLGFDDYETDHVRGPGLYLAIVANRTVEEFADPMGANTWPIETCGNANDDTDNFCAAASPVAHYRDGGVCIGVDGTILEQMVRFNNVSDDELPDGVSVENLDYRDWMGARHMSAYEISLRPDVISTITLSEESGRITTFQNGEYETTPRENIGEPWRARNTS